MNFTLKSSEVDIEESPHLVLSFPESIEYSEAVRNGSKTLICNTVIDVSINSCMNNQWCPSTYEFDYIGNVKLLLRAEDPIGE